MLNSWQRCCIGSHSICTSVPSEVLCCSTSHPPFCLCFFSCQSMLSTTTATWISSNYSSRRESFSACERQGRRWANFSRSLKVGVCLITVLGLRGESFDSNSALFETTFLLLNPAEIWLDWLKDEIRLTEEEPNREKVYELFERAVKDYLCEYTAPSSPALVWHSVITWS